MEKQTFFKDVFQIKPEWEAEATDAVKTFPLKEILGKSAAK